MDVGTGTQKSSFSHYLLQIGLGRQLVVPVESLWNLFETLKAIRYSRAGRQLETDSNELLQFETYIMTGKYPRESYKIGIIYDAKDRVRG